MPAPDTLGQWPAFISYTRYEPDRSHALTIEAALRAEGIHPWRDEHKIRPGSRFFDEIVDALENSACVIALLSKRSIRRPWVLGEVFTALTAGKLIPVALDDIKTLPFGIRQTLHVNTMSDVAAIVDRVKAGSTSPDTNSRRGIKGTARVLQELAWWPEALSDRIEMQERLALAGARFRSSRSKLRQAYEKYCQPAQIHDGLSTLRHELITGESTSDDWVALADLALPFHYDLAIAALERSDLSKGAIDARLITESLETARFERLGSPQELSKSELPSWRELSLPGNTGSLGTSIVTADGGDSRMPDTRTSDVVAAVLEQRQNSADRLERQPHHPNATAENDGSSSRNILQAIWGWLIIGGLIVAALYISTFLRGSDQRPPGDGAPVVADHHAADPNSPSYCSGTTCQFPVGHSFSEVAKDCYGDESLWTEIWEENREAFPERDPDLVYTGEQFQLPDRACTRGAGN